MLHYINQNKQMGVVKVTHHQEPSSFSALMESIGSMTDATCGNT
tara:strand:+ start:121 stop:252 length:132 start_codon:yes stop_codon:yes gene_type:complete